MNLPESDVPDVKDRIFFLTEYQAYETGLDSAHQLHCIVLRPLTLFYLMIEILLMAY